MSNVSTDEELQAWIDEQDALAEAERKERERINKLARKPFEHAKYDFKVWLYAKAIGVQ